MYLPLSGLLPNSNGSFLSSCRAVNTPQALTNPKCEGRSTQAGQGRVQ